MLKEDKVRFVEDLKEELLKSKGIILLNFKGLKFDQLNKLRQTIKSENARCKVIKNRLLKIALNKSNINSLDSYLKEETSAILVYKDFVSVAKILKKFAKDLSTLKIKCGYLDGSVLTDQDVIKIADLPSREALLGKLLVDLKMPVYNLIFVLNNVKIQLINVLNAIKEKKNK